MWSLAPAQENLWMLTEALISIKPPVYQQNNLKKKIFKRKQIGWEPREEYVFIYYTT